MHFAFNPEQLQMRDAVRGAMTAECTPEVVRKAWEAPNENLRPLLADLGVLGINAPEAMGGLGLGAVDWVLILEEAGRAALPESLVETVAAAPFFAEREAREGETEHIEAKLAPADAEAEPESCEGCHHPEMPCNKRATCGHLLCPKRIYLPSISISIATAHCG